MAMAAPLAAAGAEAAAGTAAVGASGAAAGTAAETAGAAAARTGATEAGTASKAKAGIPAAAPIDVDTLGQGPRPDLAQSSTIEHPTGDGPSFSDTVNNRVRRLQPSQQVAGGLLAALLAYPVLLNFLQGGRPQVKRWLRAKFLNDTGTGSGASTGAVANVALGGGTVTSSGVIIRPASSSSGGAGNSANAPPAGAGTGAAATAIAFARAQIGDWYLIGGNGPDRWDCSGLTRAAWAAAGVSIPRTTTLQMGAGRAVSRAQLQPGDLVFPEFGHVGIYTGNNMIVHAPHTGAQVREVPLWAFLSARRLA